MSQKLRGRIGELLGGSGEGKHRDLAGWISAANAQAESNTPQFSLCYLSKTYGSYRAGIGLRLRRATGYQGGLQQGKRTKVPLL